MCSPSILLLACGTKKVNEYIRCFPASLLQISLYCRHLFFSSAICLPSPVLLAPSSARFFPPSNSPTPSFIFLIFPLQFAFLLLPRLSSTSQMPSTNLTLIHIVSMPRADISCVCMIYITPKLGNLHMINFTQMLNSITCHLVHTSLVCVHNIYT